MSAYVKIPTMFTDNDTYVEEAGDDFENEGARPSSAPPLFSQAKEGSFRSGSFSSAKERTLIESGVEDIRTKPNYPEFYEKNHHLFNLPPPFDPTLYKFPGGKQERHYVDEMFNSNPVDESGRYSPTLDVVIPSDRNGGASNVSAPISPSAASSQPFGAAPFSLPNPISSAKSSAAPPTSQNGRSPLKSPLNGAGSQMLSFSPLQPSQPIPTRPQPAQTFVPVISSSRAAFVSHDLDSGNDSDEDILRRRASDAGQTGKSPIWKPFRKDEGSPRPRNKSLGKLAINADTNLSSSTEDLLTLAGNAAHHKDAVRISDSPPTPSAMSMKEMRDSSRVRITTFPKTNSATELPHESILEQDSALVNPPGALPLPHLPQPTVPQVQLGPGQVAVPVPVPLPVPIPLNHRGPNMMSMPMNHQSIQMQIPTMQGMQNMAIPLPISPLEYAQFLQQSFAHLAVMNPAMAPQQGQPRNICRFYQQGFCTRGNQCTFMHVDQTMAQRNTPQSAPMQHPAAMPTAPPQSLKQQPRMPPSNPARYQNLKLEECTGQIAMMCLDQHGCRFLQKELDDNDDAKRDAIFAEVIPHIADLMSDPFGNYLCQKLIEKCTPAQRLEIVRGCTNELVAISKNMHGTRAVQRLIEALETPEEFRLVREALKGNVVALIQDLNGNHVIQKCLNKMEPNDNQFIYDAVALNCVQVATHRHGCCVFQRCVDHATLDQKKQLVEQIKNNGIELVQDAYGNYVVQYVLDLDLPNLASELIERLQTKLYYLARQKFSSNVVEKCLKVGNNKAVVRIMRELLFENPDPNSLPTPLPGKDQAQTKLFSLLQDSYGNYVVQTCLSEGAQKAPREYAEMSNLLRPVVHQLSRNVPYMKRIQSLLFLPTSPLHSDDESSDLDASLRAEPAVSTPTKPQGKSKSKPPSRRESNARDEPHRRRRHSHASDHRPSVDETNAGASSKQTTQTVTVPNVSSPVDKHNFTATAAVQGSSAASGHARAQLGTGGQRR